MRARPQPRIITSQSCQAASTPHGHGGLPGATPSSGCSGVEAPGDQVPSCALVKKNHLETRPKAAARRLQTTREHTGCPAQGRRPGVPRRGLMRSSGESAGRSPSPPLLLAGTRICNTGPRAGNGLCREAKPSAGGKETLKVTV